MRSVIFFELGPEVKLLCWSSGTYDLLLFYSEIRRVVPVVHY